MIKIQSNFYMKVLLPDQKLWNTHFKRNLFSSKFQKWRTSNLENIKTENCTIKIYLVKILIFSSKYIRRVFFRHVGNSVEIESLVNIVQPRNEWISHILNQKHQLEKKFLVFLKK